jgi:hypothetical protein
VRREPDSRLIEERADKEDLMLETVKVALDEGK